jgi:hypothetical protein
LDAFSAIIDEELGQTVGSVAMEQRTAIANHQVSARFWVLAAAVGLLLGGAAFWGATSKRSVYFTMTAFTRSSRKLFPRRRLSNHQSTDGPAADEISVFVFLPALLDLGVGFEFSTEHHFS